MKTTAQGRATSLEKHRETCYIRGKKREREGEDSKKENETWEKEGEKGDSTRAKTRIEKSAVRIRVGNKRLIESLYQETRVWKVR